MNREDIQKLLGGYATGTLTPEEQQALFEAALSDQELFDALAREQSLRDLLRDPAARAQLLASIDDQPAPWYRRFWRPIAVAATAACALGIGVYMMREKPHAVEKPVLTAQVAAPQADVPAAAVPAPAPPPQAAVEPPVRKQRVVAESTPAARPAAPAAVAIDGPPPAVEAAPAAPPPAPKVAVAADTPQELVTVDGQAISLQNAQAMFYDQSLGANHFVQPQTGAPAVPKDRSVQAYPTLQSVLAKARAANLGVKWTVLRQGDSGFVEAAADQLRAGDAVRLRLIPNDDGFITVWDGKAPVLASTRVQRFIPLETPVIRGEVAGQKILTVQFAREAAAQPARVRNVSEQQSATDAAEHATYVLNVNGNPVTPVSLRVPLTFK